MGNDSKDSKSDNGGVSELRRQISRIALALIIANLLWMGSTVYNNSIDLSVLKNEMDHVHKELEDLKK